MAHAVCLVNGGGHSALPKRPNGANLSVPSPINWGIPVKTFIGQLKDIESATGRCVALLDIGPLRGKTFPDRRSRRSQTASPTAGPTVPGSNVSWSIVCGSAIAGSQSSTCQIAVANPCPTPMGGIGSLLMVRFTTISSCARDCRSWGIASSPTAIVR